MEETKKVEETSNVSNVVTETTTVEAVKAVESVKAVEVVEETKEISQEVSQEVAEQDNSDVFVTENDTFDIKISYYKTDGAMFVEGVDDDFDTNNSSIKTIDVIFKYPSHGDYETIVAQATNKNLEKMTYIDVLQLELTRIVILIRKWSINAEFTRMVELDPKIIKAMTNKVRDRIGIKGIM